MKMLAIYARIRCGVPVVLMGECGCGKTMLIRYLCAYLNVKLFVLDVNGGTREQDILQIFQLANDYLEGHPQEKQVYVFLDEINTCPHMGLMCEAICHRSLLGSRIKEGIRILAALNPYRRRTNQSNNTSPGLVYTLHNQADKQNMVDLVYRVHPIPHTLRDFIFDFGSLDKEDELAYINAMVKSTFQHHEDWTEQLAPSQQLVSQMILQSQYFIRTVMKIPVPLVYETFVDA